MRPIPQKLRDQMEKDPAMHSCIYFNEDCKDEYGHKHCRAEWEHCFIYAGKQINEWWAIIGVCWYHHRGPGLNKDYNRFRALMRMSEADLDEAQKKYPKTNWRFERERLIKKFNKKNVTKNKKIMEEIGAKLIKINGIDCYDFVIEIKIPINKEVLDDEDIDLLVLLNGLIVDAVSGEMKRIKKIMNNGK